MQYDLHQCPKWCVCDGKPFRVHSIPYVHLLSAQSYDMLSRSQESEDQIYYMEPEWWSGNPIPITPTSLAQSPQHLVMPEGGLSFELDKSGARTGASTKAVGARNPHSSVDLCFLLT